MGIANYTNLSELMNKMLETGDAVSISDLVREAEKKKIILASEGEPADRGDLENAFIALADVQCRAGVIRPDPRNESEVRVIGQYESGELARNGYGGDAGDRFLGIRWLACTGKLPVIVNINL